MSTVKKHDRYKYLIVCILIVIFTVTFIINLLVIGTFYIWQFMNIRKKNNDIILTLSVKNIKLNSELLTLKKLNDGLNHNISYLTGELLILKKINNELNTEKNELNQTITYLKMSDNTKFITKINELNDKLTTCRNEIIELNRSETRYFIFDLSDKDKNKISQKISLSYIINLMYPEPPFNIDITYFDGSYYIGEIYVGFLYTKYMHGKGKLVTGKEKHLSNTYDAYTTYSGTWDYDKLKGNAIQETYDYRWEGMFENGYKNGGFRKYHKYSSRKWNEVWCNGVLTSSTEI